MPAFLRSLNRGLCASVWLATVKDIFAGWKKPGRDPRRKFRYFASFEEGVEPCKDLEPGMSARGSGHQTVTLLAPFVDIGVHRTVGHISAWRPCL